MGGEQIFSVLVIAGFSLYSAVLLWLTFAYRDEQKLLPDDSAR